MSASISDNFNLIQAAKGGDFNTVISLLEGPVLDYYIPLQEAVSKGHLEVVKMLVSKVDQVHEDVLVKAASRGFVEVLKVLLSKFKAEGPSRRACYTRMLVKAVKGTRSHVVRYLLDLPDRDIEPALIKATEKGNLYMVRVLSSHDINYPTAISIARHKGYESVLRELEKGEFFKWDRCLKRRIEAGLEPELEAHSSDSDSDLDPDPDRPDFKDIKYRLRLEDLKNGIDLKI